MGNSIPALTWQAHGTRGFMVGWVFAFVAGCMPSNAAAQIPAEPLAVEAGAFMNALTFRTRIDVSPDGEWIAYTVTDPRRAHMPGNGVYTNFSDTGVWVEALGTAIRITDTRTRETHELTKPEVNAWAPRWSPDGQYLAFYSDARGEVNVWLWERVTGEMRRLSEHVARPVWTWEAPRWTPDSRHVVAKLLPVGVTLKEANRLARREGTAGVVADGMPSVRVFGADGPYTTSGEPTATTWPPWYRWSYGGDLAVIPLDGGSIRWLVTDLIPTWWDVSPDGRWLAFLHVTGRAPDGFGSSRALAITPLVGGQGVDVAREIHQSWGLEVSWSPDGGSLAWTTGGDESGAFVASAPNWEALRVSDLRPGWGRPYDGPIWDASDGGLLFASGDALWRVPVVEGMPATEIRVPGWSISQVFVTGGGSTALQRDGKIVLRAFDRQRRVHGFFQVDPAGGSVEPLSEDVGTYYTGFTTAITGDGETVVLQYANSQQPPDLWVAGPDLRRMRRITVLNPGFEGLRLGTTQLVQWNTEDGRELEGTLLLPPGHRTGTRVPVVVEVYGGSSGSAELHRFDPIRQLFATRGYGVLVPDVPITVGSPMQDIAAAVLPALDAVIELGVADANRLGAWGHSYGGYSVLALLVQTDRFRTAAASASQGNLFGMHGQLDPSGEIFMTRIVESGQGRMGGTPWDMRERYVDNSPYFFLDRVTTPLLLLHGAEDRNTAAHLAEQIYAGLRRLGRPVVYVRYEGEDHWWGRYRPENRLDFWERVVDWFETHLK